MPARPAVSEGGCDGALAARVLTALDTAFPTLHRSLRKTLAVVCTGFLGVMAAARSGNGALALAALARVLPCPGRAHSRETRLQRFLNNRRLEGRAVSTGLARHRSTRAPGEIPCPGPPAVPCSPTSKRPRRATGAAFN